MDEYWLQDFLMPEENISKINACIYLTKSEAVFLEWIFTTSM